MAAGHSPITNYEMRRMGYLFVAEAGRKIGVTPQTIYRWIDNENSCVTGFQDGYRRYVLWSTILAHLGPVATQVRGLQQKDVFVETVPK